MSMDLVFNTEWPVGHTTNLGYFLSCRLIELYLSRLGIG